MTELNTASLNLQKSPMKRNACRQFLFLTHRISFLVCAKDHKDEKTRRNLTQDFKSTAVLPYIKGVSEVRRRFLQQQGVRTVFKSDTTLRSHLVRPKDVLDSSKQDGVVYKIPCICGKAYIGKTGRSMHERIKKPRQTYGLLTPN